MKERPILFSGAMVRSLLNCTKSQTRRVVKPTPSPSTLNPPSFEDKKVGEIFVCPDLFDPKTSVFVEYEGGGRYHNMGSDVFARKHCPYGQPGDRLFVRENGWERPERTPKMMREGADTWARYYYDADGYNDTDSEQFRAWGFKRRPSIHMPRWASRILLEIVSVRIERLQDISAEDAIAEGISIPITQSFTDINVFRAAYRDLWESINGPGSWAANPWVWVVEFRRLA